MCKSLSHSRVIDARGVHKRFGTTTALDGLDLTVAAGEVHGFLGPNGAGKSTTIRAILGQIRLDGGYLSVFGLHPRRDAVAVHRRLAYVPGDTALWPGLTGGECIDLLGKLHGGLDTSRRDDLIARFDLDPTKRTRSYSKGNRQKVALVAALSIRAELLLLDEPTSGLDPLMEAEFQRAVRESVDAGSTVLLSSHILDEVEALCDRVTIIRAGRAVSSGTLEDLRASTRTTVEFVTDAVPDLSALAGVSAVTHRSAERGVTTSFEVDTEHLTSTVAQVAADGVRSLTVRPPSLEELFHSYYEAAAS